MTYAFIVKDLPAGEYSFSPSNSNRLLFRCGFLARPVRGAASAAKAPREGAECRRMM
jgi:hypothetical protein